MSRLQQYLLFGVIVFLVQFTSLGHLLQSASFLNVMLGIIGCLLVIAVLITVRTTKKRKRGYKDPVNKRGADA